MRIIVAGIGEVGRHLAAMLANSYHDIVAIDPLASNLNALQDKADLVTVQGSATSPTILQSAEVGKTDLFVAVASAEETNIISAAMAKKLGAKRVVARIDNNEYLTPHNQDLFTSLGIDSLIYPEKLASQAVIGLLGEGGAMAYIHFAQGKLTLAAYRIETTMPYIGLTLAQIRKHYDNLNFLVVAIARDGETIIPSGEDTLRPGDLIHVISTPRGVDEWRRITGSSAFSVNNLFVLGASRMGIRTCLDLEGKVKKIKLFESDREKCERIAPLFRQTTLVHGDGRNTDFLLAEGLEEADAFAAMTGSSETNILTCLAARRAGVRQIIAEVENLDYITLAESIGIDSVVNKKLITASRIFRYTMGGDVSSMRYLTGSDAEVFEFVAKAGSPATRGRIKDLHIPPLTIAGGIIRGDSAFIATGETIIQPGDRVIVFTTSFAAGKVARFFN